MKHLLILLSFLLLSSPVICQETGVLYQYETSSGIKYVGEFKDGELWNGIFYEKNGNIIEKWVNGVKQ